MPQDAAAFGAFLRSRRDALSPAQAGLEPVPGPRRVSGLRREELAMLAGVSSDYLRRLEQGRQVNVSSDVLDALARALRLDDVERSHLRDLAGPPVGRRKGGEVAQRPDPGLLRVMDALDHLPSLLLGRRFEVLARNSLLVSVLGRDFEPGTSFARFLFFDSIARERIVNWRDFASALIGAMRRETGRHPGDVRLQALVDDLTARDPDAARWWADQRVRDYTSVAKRIDHPVGGRLDFDIEIVAAPHEHDQRLIVYTATPDSKTAQTLPLLAKWTSVPVR